MRNFLLLIIILCNTRYANCTSTYISGNVTSCKHDQVELVIFGVNHLYNDYRFKAWKYNLTLRQGKFNLNIDSLNIISEHCYLNIGRKQVFFSLSPGDSLVISFDYRNVESTIEFAGRGASKSTYYNSLLNLGEKQYTISFTPSLLQSWGRGKELLSNSLSLTKEYMDNNPKERAYFEYMYYYELFSGFSKMWSTAQPQLKWADSVTYNYIVNDFHTFLDTFNLHNTALEYHTSFYGLFLENYIIYRHFGSADNVMKTKDLYNNAEQYISGNILANYKALFLYWKALLNSNYISILS